MIGQAYVEVQCRRRLAGIVGGGPHGGYIPTPERVFRVYNHAIDILAFELVVIPAAAKLLWRGALQRLVVVVEVADCSERIAAILGDLASGITGSVDIIFGYDGSTSLFDE